VLPRAQAGLSQALGVSMRRYEVNADHRTPFDPNQLERRARIDVGFVVCSGSSRSSPRDNQVSKVGYCRAGQRLGASSPNPSCIRAIAICSPTPHHSSSSDGAAALRRTYLAVRQGVVIVLGGAAAWLVAPSGHLIGRSSGLVFAGWAI